MLAVLLIVALGTLCPFNFAELEINLLQPADGVLTGRFSDAFLLRFPSCDPYGGKDVTLLYQETSGNKNESETFKVPKCDDATRPPGFLLNKLKNGTKYSMWYKIADETSVSLIDSTAKVSSYNEIDDGLQARTAAMIVITVILVLAMVALLLSLIFLLFFFRT